MKNNTISKVRSFFILICQLILGATFIFSGFVKAVDPYGFVYKIQDYLTAFGLDALAPLALAAAVILISLEFILGINMFLGMHVKITYILTLLFMLVMTPLTLYLALFDPVKDCGCFGDALIISNWETFGKNVVLLVLTIFILIYHKDVRSPYSDKMQWLTTFSSVLFIIGIILSGYVRLPIFDFRPYKIGTNIPEAMILPENAVMDEYKSTFIYEKDGVLEEFDSLNEAPVNDTTWTFVDAKHILIKEGDKPPIHDFSITDIKSREDITNDVLHFPDYVFLLISYQLSGANIEHIDQINDIFDYATDKGYGFYCLTASTDEEIARYENYMGAEYPFCNSDEITLKTIIRSNPGLMLIKDGVIYNKWHYNNFPTDVDLGDKSLEDTIYGEIDYPDNTKRLILVSVSFVALLLLVFGLDKLFLWISSKRKRRKDMKMWHSKNKD